MQARTIPHPTRAPAKAPIDRFIYNRTKQAACPSSNSVNAVRLRVLLSMILQMSETGVRNQEIERARA